MSNFEKETPTTIDTPGGLMSALPRIERGSGSITHRRFSARRGDARRCVVTPGRAGQGKEKSNNAEKKE